MNIHEGKDKKIFTRLFLLGVGCTYFRFYELVT